MTDVASHKKLRNGGYDAIHKWLKKHYGKADKCQAEIVTGLLEKHPSTNTAPGSEYNKLKRRLPYANTFDTELQTLVDSCTERGQLNQAWFIPKLKALLERVDREGRLAELLNIPFNDERFSNTWIKQHWVKRIEILQAKNGEL